MCAWLRERGVAFDDIPLLDTTLIHRIIDPPRDEKGRLRVRPKRSTRPRPWYELLRAGK